MTAGVSKARLRRPTLTWRTIPAASRRFIASLVAWKLRPMIHTLMSRAALVAPDSVPALSPSRDKGQQGRADRP